jgi:hypothetical protein
VPSARLLAQRVGRCKYKFANKIRQVSGFAQLFVKNIEKRPEKVALKKISLAVNQMTARLVGMKCDFFTECR